MRVYNCHFCGSPCYPGHGMLFVRNDAKEFRFCRSKCHKNFKMKRNPRKLKWTKAFRKAAGKEMVVDSTLSFSARRNVPVRYNRDLVETTLQGMSRIEEIRLKRERAFYKNRMRGNKERQREEDRKLVESNPELLRMRDVELARLAEKEAAQGELSDLEAIEAPNLVEVSENEMEESDKEEIKQKKPISIKIRNKKMSKKHKQSDAMDLD
ncbi:hypothetical protein NADFUDRAFT_45795 [Nadsonia fulvescens var. elongata DSM 6958]|uniref:Ribosome biogenesis protein RLP24 n=1 Tax=Nadsonia fulvescens var. elongata DSM 6958 TaxID=857566 RepID=A0A1E3PLW7_9ASCO|nr:hypothetical protein NADFUDRAFT_45795 [Nadsonia fulvescens var. elongata DSM 6958]